MKPVYIIGHKNPDLDSVASAIGYQAYKHMSDQGLYQAAVAGELNKEAVYVLDTLGFAKPLWLKSVANTVEDLLDDQQQISHVYPDTSLLELSQMMRQQKIKTVPVLNEAGKFLGLITIGDVALIFMDNLGDAGSIEQSPSILRRVLQQRVGEIMKSRDLVVFESDDGVDEARKQMLKSRFRNYPVVDDNNTYLGMISRYHLLQMKRKQLILVDHNEKQQAVDGVDQAEILEIIDHHRVGDLQTISPIYFHNEPVGSTSTLIAEKFLDSSFTLDKALAGLLLSGILSDTLIFRSPTTSPKDRRIANCLERISGLDPIEWGKQIFSQAMQLGGKDERELVGSDLKEYSSGDMLFAIAQIETIDVSGLEVKKTAFLKAMQELCRERDYAFMCLMLTDILDESSELLIAGRERSLLNQALGGSSGPDRIYLPGVMSRKKQILPVIYDILRRKDLLG